MAKDVEFLRVKYKEGSLDPKTAGLIRFAVCLAVGYESGARLRLKDALAGGASADEVWETVNYAMRPGPAKVRDLAEKVIAETGGALTTGRGAASTGS